jgi:hypothetical protein
MEFCRLDSQWHIQTGLDNTSVLKRETECRQRETELPCCCKAPDAGVMMHTSEAMDHPPTLAFSTEHVPGHQDKKTPFDKLPRMAQPSVLADWLSTSALQKQLQWSRMGAKIFCPLPSCPAHLQQVNGHTITSCKHLHMKNCTPESDVDTRCKVKFKWKDNVLKLIDWTAHRQAHRQLADFMLKFAAKLETGRLPTNSRLHLQRECSNDQCILCKQRETQAHLVQCSQCGDWRAAFLQCLSEHLTEEKTAADVWMLTAHALGDWMEGRDPTRVCPRCC